MVMTEISISISDGLFLNSLILQLLMVGGGPYQLLQQEDQLGSDTELSGKMSQSCQPDHFKYCHIWSQLAPTKILKYIC